VSWARASDPWWRRTALASTVTLNLRSRGGLGDTRRTLLICRHFARERNPMLAKALSWALRSLVPHDKESVRAFVRQHHETLPAIVKREVGTKIRTGRKAR
jgi:3-methyladenine DNA glycosylase AlkD